MYVVLLLAGVPPSAPPSAGADLAQFINDNPGGERRHRLLLTGAALPAPPVDAHTGLLSICTALMQWPLTG